MSNDQASDDPTAAVPEPAGVEPSTEPDLPAAEQPDEPDPDPSEAAKYRRRLRAAEKERDELAGQLDAMRRAEITRLATTGDGPRLHAAGDVFTADYDLAQVLTDDGAIDPDKVRASIEHHTDGRSHLRADLRQPRPDPSQGGGGRSAPATSSSGQGWADALRGR